MNRSLTQLVIGLFSAAAVIAIAVVDSKKAMPGELSAVHEAVPELAGGDDCTLCHGGVFNSMAEACLECHGLIEEHGQLGEGLHGTLGEERLDQCSLCHSEHHGSGFSLVNRQSFAQAGTSGPDEFDHSLVGYAREGAHVDLGCVDCHENAENTVLGEGQHRFIGLDPSCVACHEDQHEGRLGNECASCHSQESFEVRAFEGHETWLSLSGAHATVGCRDCHAEGDAHALERVLKGGAERRECSDCHASPHTPEFVRAEAEATGRTEGSSCRSCHRSEHLSFRDERLELAPLQHSASGFVLAAPHAEASCTDCHASELESFEERHPGRAARDCASCHEDPHGGQFADPDGGVSCLDCHEAQRFTPHLFTEKIHATRAIPLEHSHGGLDCADCHLEPAPGAPRQFRGTARECVACHEDSHRGFFDARAFLDGRPGVTDCDACHQATRFSDAPRSEFDHLRWTGFEVRGSHAQNGCESCHIPSPEPDETGRSFGRVEDHFGVAGGCEKCHADPHGGAFSAARLPREVEGRGGCARCHGEVSFRELPHEFDHGLWTGFDLRGAHGEARCTTCHKPTGGADERGRTWLTAAGKDCAECHADPHAGQFAEHDALGSATRCDRCHTEQPGFTAARFDHDRDSDFPLEEHHASLECAACHKTVPFEGAAIVRYKPLGKECVDCHGIQERALLRRKRRRP